MSNSVCEEKIFSSIYNDYAEDLHNYLYYRYGDQFDVNDKVQEAFIKLLKHQQIKPKDYTSESPEHILEQDQFYQKYQNALSKLTEEQRTAFLLNKVEGKKHIEIAEMLGITKKVVEYRIYSAFKIIKEHIKEFK